MVSTPTNRGASRIEEAFEQSDQRQYYVPCKHCEKDQVLKWANVRWQDDDPETAAYMCDNCGTLWSDADRRWSIRNGVWKANAEFKGVAGFAINGLYSPWTPLADGVRDFLSVKKNPEQLRVWTNTYLGETWEDAGETIDDYSLSERREVLETVPDEVIFLTCGVDVQDNRLEYSVIGWGRDDESWVIEHGTLYGDPSTPQLWTNLDSVIFRQFDTVSGRQMAIRGTCVDSGGHFTNAVYQYCKKHTGRRVFAIKGVGGEGKPAAGRPSKSNVAKCPLFPVGVDTIKSLLFARMRIDEPGAGYIHFSDRLNDEYFRQLTAEKVVTRFHKGFKKRVFEKIRARNEALDCMCYSYAAYAIIGVNVNTLADKMEAETTQKVDNEQIERKQQPRRQQFVPKTGRNFVNSWR
jgi:phage terminase large subunit GpA-like protein